MKIQKQTLALVISLSIAAICLLVLPTACEPKVSIPRRQAASHAEDAEKVRVARQLDLTVEQLERLETEGRYARADLLRMPPETLKKALRKLDHPKPQHPGAAALYRFEQRLSENGTIADNALMIAKQQRDAMIAAQNAAADPREAGLEPGAPAWRWLGPGNTGGRIRSLLVDPNQPATMYAGSVSGGIWKTLNGGASWFPLNDFMANLSVATLAMDPNNASVLYAGTGEGVFGIISLNEGGSNIAALRGAGIFKSSDAGATWSQLASTATSNFWYVNRIAIHPTNSQVLLAATNNGIFRSTNGGTSWTQRTITATYDVGFDPANGNRAVAGLTGAAHYSTDGGVTWFVATFSGIGGGAGRIELDVSPTTGRVYASIDINNGEVWRSLDGGQTYAQIYTGPENYLGGQGWYNNMIWAVPFSHVSFDILLVGGIDLWRATPNGGGATYSLTKISDWTRVPSPGDSAHADHHVIVPHPAFNFTSNKIAFAGNDGGVYGISDVATVTTNSGWTNLNNRLGVTQFYGGAAHPTSGTVIAGSQDVGTVRFTGDTETWGQTFGGDGGACLSDPADSTHYYGEYVYAQVFRSANGGASASYIYGGPFPLSDAASANTANFIAPMVLDPNNTTSLLVGADQLWRTDTAKSAAPAWYSIRAGDGSGGNNISAIAIAQGNPDIVWVGYNNGDLWMSTNATSGSRTWTRVDTNSPGLPNRWISSIAIDPANHSRVYVTLMGYFNNGVWRTTNAGTSWSVITGAGPTMLPAAPVSSIALHPANSGWLYVGTDVGVFASQDDGATWSTSNDGPANVTIDQLFFRDGRTLVAVTHGRGVWLFEPPHLTVVGVSNAGVQPFNGTFSPSISGYGDLVAFATFDSLEVGDSNGQTDVYVRDRAAGTTTRVSVASDGTQGNSYSSDNEISADGRFVGFFSGASNLVPGDNNGFADIFVHDRQTGTTTRVSVASDGSEGNGDVPLGPGISADGRYVSFCSAASNLVTGDNNSAQDMFVHDRSTGNTTRVSVTSSGAEANGNSSGGRGSISADGRYVAFESNATNLVTGDNSGSWDVFVHDRQTGATIRASVTTSGGEVSAFTVRPRLSADGRYVLFESGGDFLSGGDTNGFIDVYLRDRDVDGDGIFDEAGAVATRRISVATDGTEGDNHSGMFGAFSISSDGRYVAFASDASNFAADDTNNRTDIFLHDRDADDDGIFDESGAISTKRISLTADGVQGSFGNFPTDFGWSRQPVMSCNGGVIAFNSTSALVNPDTNNEKTDIYAYDRLYGTGDVNLDGVVNGKDQQAFLAVLLGQNTNVAAIAEADLNRDGSVDLVDSNLLVKRLLGLCP